MAKSRKELEHRQRRKYILECAEKLFAEKGFDRVTVADIAEASEFSVGSLYLFFDSKEALIQSLLMERLKQVHDLINGEYRKNIPSREKLDNVVAGVHQLFHDHLSYFKLHILEVKGAEWCKPTDKFGEEFHAVFLRTFDLIGKIFQQGIDEGVFRNVEPLYMAFFLDACMHSLIHYTFIKGDDIDIDNIFKGMKEMLYHGILRGEDIE
jgi:AcrR family transcriptional regulator